MSNKETKLGFLQNALESETQTSDKSHERINNDVSMLMSQHATMDYISSHC